MSMAAPRPPRVSASARALPVVCIDAPEGKYDFQNKYYTDVVQ